MFLIIFLYLLHKHGLFSYPLLLCLLSECKYKNIGFGHVLSDPTDTFFILCLFFLTMKVQKPSNYVIFYLFVGAMLIKHTQVSEPSMSGDLSDQHLDIEWKLKHLKVFRSPDGVQIQAWCYFKAWWSTRNLLNPPTYIYTYIHTHIHKHIHTHTQTQYRIERTFISQ